MAAGKSMTSSNFLEKSRTHSWGEEKRTQSFTWDCYPGNVYYYYCVPGGSTQRKGYYDAVGICRYSNGNYYRATSRNCFENVASTTPDLQEGVKCVKIQYRYNNGSWTVYRENKNGLSEKECELVWTFDQPGETLEIKCTYQVWTMGHPYKDVPFMWFGDDTGLYNSGKNQFKQETVAPPQRGWAGMDNWTSTKNSGTNQNAGWKIKTVTWFRPNSTSHSTNWAYLHAQYWNKEKSVNPWKSTYKCEYWKSGMNHELGMGWTGNVTGRSPQTSRKTIWWNFEKTYSDKVTSSSDIVTKPEPLTNPTVTLKAANNLKVVDSNNVLNGIKGSVTVTYKQKEGKVGHVNIYAVTTDENGKAKTIKVTSDKDIAVNTPTTITYDFSKCGFLRGKSIAYYAEAYVIDEEYNNTKRYGYSSGKTFDDCTANGKHYYNNQPPAPTSFSVKDNGDLTKQAPLVWSSCKDPDGHAFTYYIYVCREDSTKNTNSVTLYCPDKKTVKYYQKFSVSSTSNAYDLDTTKYTKDEKIQLYISPADEYYDTVYYATKLGCTIDTDVTVTLTVTNNMTNKNADGKYLGDEGTLSYKYVSKHGRKGRILIYAYEATKDYNKESGVYLKKIYDTKDYTVESDSTITIKLDFAANGFTRGRYYKYFARAIDSEEVRNPQPYSSVTDANMWSHNDCKGYHYFNSVPKAVTPFITESSTKAEDVFQDELVELAWSQSTDVEKHNIYYYLYMEVVGNSKNKSEVFYTSLSSTGTTKEYTKVFNLGKDIDFSATNPYKIDFKEHPDYIGKKINFWIKTKDNYNAKKYLIGSVLSLNNPGVKPEVPEIEIDYVYNKDFFGENKQSGEEGYVSVSHTHSIGRAGTVKLHAIAKNISTGETKLFKDITSWTINSGSWSPKTKLNFKTIFGEDWRGSDIRYYAVSTTSYGECSEDEGWEPKASMWDKWVPGHKFNEEPSGAKLSFNDKLSNLHYNAVFDWSAATDPDDTLYPVRYAVVLYVKSDPRKEMTFFHGPDKTGDLIKTFTDIWDTTNTRIEIDLDGYDEGEEFEIWVVPHDDYTNSYYYTTNAYKFKKASFGKPKVEVTLSQKESEKGTVKVKYLHEDVEYKDGNYVSKDPDRKVSDFVGLINVYCYVNDRFTANYMIENKEITIGKTLSFDIPFEEVSPLSRSVEIRYVVIAEDKESKVRSMDISPSKAEVEHFVVGAHYYNDEPENPSVRIGDLKSYVSEEQYEKDKFVYGFDYTFICWNRPYEPDGDRCVYYAYLKTPESFKEAELTTTVNRRDDMGNVEPVLIKYNRKYKIVEKYDNDNRLYGSDLYYYTDVANNKTTLLQKDNPFIGFQLDYKKDHLGKAWPLMTKADADKEEFKKDHLKLFVEARDVRSLTNSYYGLSDEFDTYRMKHEPPNDVVLKVTPNLSDGIGDGERGKMSVLYTHPEGDIPGKVDIYAFQNDKDGNFILKGKVFTVDNIYNGVEQTVEIDFLNNENSDSNTKEYRLLDRSKKITYYAIATDHLVGMTSYDKYDEIGLQMKYIPYLIPDAEGKLNHYMLYINGKAHDYNDKEGHYVGPVLSGVHYFNEEPPETTPIEANKENISLNFAEIKWPHVKDPDGDDVKYELYVATSEESLNTKEAEFYNDTLEALCNIEQGETIEFNDVEMSPIAENDIVVANGMLRYHKMVEIPASLAAESAAGLSVATSEYSEDSTIQFWIVSKDPYTNSYYRAGNILSMIKGHKARDVRSVYPRNGSTVYATRPRILINLAEDNQKQTVYVQWKDKTYNNKEHPEHFSNHPGVTEAIVFKPPVPFTTLHGMKVTYSVWVHNQCSYSNKTYVTYTYKDFFNEFTEEKLIALKSDHVNAFRNAINITRDAYGLETVKFTREIRKNMIFENFDFNETKYAICAVNDLLNQADETDLLDYNDELIVDLKDLDLVDYEGDILTGSYNEFLEWARLVYILENL